MLSALGARELVRETAASGIHYEVASEADVMQVPSGGAMDAWSPYEMMAQQHAHLQMQAQQMQQQMQQMQQMQQQMQQATGGPLGGAGGPSAAVGAVCPSPSNPMLQCYQNALLARPAPVLAAPSAEAYPSKQDRAASPLPLLEPVARRLPSLVDDSPRATASSAPSLKIGSVPTHASWKHMNPDYAAETAVAPVHVPAAGAAPAVRTAAMDFVAFSQKLQQQQQPQKALGVQRAASAPAPAATPAPAAAPAFRSSHPAYLAMAQQQQQQQKQQPKAADSYQEMPASVDSSPYRHASFSHAGGAPAASAQRGLGKGAPAFPSRGAPSAVAPSNPGLEAIIRSYNTI